MYLFFFFFFFHRSVNALVCEMSYCETVPFIIISSINIILKFKQCQEQTNCEKTLECAKTLFLPESLYHDMENTKLPVLVNYLIEK